MVLIGIAGRAGSGKSLIGDWLDNQHHFSQYEMARNLKTMLKVGLGLTDDELEHPIKKEQPLKRLGLSVSPRQLFQSLGTEWGRDQVDSGLWIQLAERDIQSICTRNNRIVITDIRYENEAKWLRAVGGSLIHITRPGHMIDASGHASEVGLIVQSEDYLIINDGTIPHLTASVRSVVDELTQTQAAGVI